MRHRAHNIAGDATILIAVFLAPKLNEVEVQAEEGRGGGFEMFALVGAGLDGCDLAQFELLFLLLRLLIGLLPWRLLLLLFLQIGRESDGEVLAC